MYLQLFATSLCFREHPQLFFPLVREDLLLLVWRKGSACSCGPVSVPVPRVLLSQGEEDGNFWERRTGALDTYQKVSEQYIQTAVQQHTFSGWWLKWSNPVPVSSCLHSGHCCFSFCKELNAYGLSPGLLDKQFLFMELLGDEIFRYLGMPWKPGGVRDRDFYGRCLCKLNIWLFWRSLRRLCNLHYCFCTFCLFPLILVLYLLTHWSTWSER